MTLLEKIVESAKEGFSILFFTDNHALLGQVCRMTGSRPTKHFAASLKELELYKGDADRIVIELIERSIRSLNSRLPTDD